jgi:hypothetical protein
MNMNDLREDGQIQFLFFPIEFSLFSRMLLIYLNSNIPVTNGKGLNSTNSEVYTHYFSDEQGKVDKKY